MRLQPFSDVCMYVRLYEGYRERMCVWNGMIERGCAYEMVWWMCVWNGMIEDVHMKWYDRGCAYEMVW